MRFPKVMISFARRSIKLILPSLVITTLHLVLSQDKSSGGCVHRIDGYPDPPCYPSRGALPTVHPHPSSEYLAPIPCYYNPRSPIPAFRIPLALRDSSVPCVQPALALPMEWRFSNPRSRTQTPSKIPPNRVRYPNNQNIPLGNYRVPSIPSDTRSVPCKNEDFRPAVYRCPPSLFGQ